MVQINENQNGLLLSVQRSGTRFTQRILTAGGLKTAQLHSAPTMMDRIELWLERCCQLGLPIVIPMRHPVSVAKSWYARGDQLDDMFEQWRLMIQCAERCRPWFLPVDHPERDEFLAELSEGIGGERLKTDWHKYGSKPGSQDVILNKSTMNQLNELIATEFVSAFYTEDVPHGT